VVHLHPEDAEALSVDEGDTVLVRVDGEAELSVVLDASLAPGTIYVPFVQRGSVGIGAIGTVTVAPAGSGGA
jgi:formylmethanofuran dehydrogenase subunit D